MLVMIRVDDDDNNNNNNNDEDDADDDNDEKRIEKYLRNDKIQKKISVFLINKISQTEPAANNNSKPQRKWFFLSFYPTLN